MNIDDDNPDLGNEPVDEAFLKKKHATTFHTPQDILHVDDDQHTLELVSHLLTGAGYNVVSRNSGFEALKEFRTRPYDFKLVLLDLTMPFMDGEETFRRLREIRSDVAVILCTGFIHQERLSALRSAGLTGFLRKPIAPDEIVRVVRTTLATARYVDGREGMTNAAVGY